MHSKLGMGLTVIRWIVRLRAVHVEGGQEGQQILRASRVDALTFSYGVQVVEHGEGQGTRLVDCTDNCPALFSELLEKIYQLVGSRTIQAPV